MEKNIKIMDFSLEDILYALKNINKRFVSEKTGIPYDRIAKWAQGKGKPKAEDFQKLKNYFDSIGQISDSHLNMMTERILTIASERREHSVAEDRPIPPYGDDKWIDPNLSVVQNIDKIIGYAEEGYITKEDSKRIISKIINK